MKSQPEMSRETAALEIYRNAETAVRRQETMIAVEQVGAIKGMIGITRFLNAQFIRALQAFRNGDPENGTEPGYARYGYENFDEFLRGEMSDYISVDQFYRHQQMLDREGDNVFNTFGMLRIPQQVRRQLPPGEIQIEGDEIVIGEKRIQIEDRTTIVETVRALAAQNAAKDAELTAAQTELGKAEKRLTRTERLLQQAETRAAMGPSSSPAILSPVARAKMVVAVAVTELIEAVDELPQDERLAEYRDTCTFVDNQAIRTWQAFGLLDGHDVPAKTTE